MKEARMSESTNEPTSVSLLKQLQEAMPSAEMAWRRFVKLYTPLLFLWALRVGACEEEAVDLVQDVFQVLSREMPGFRLPPGLRFRAWLWTMLLDRWGDRARQQVAQLSVTALEEPETFISPDKIEKAAEKEYRAYLIARALELMRAELPAGEWQACLEYMVKGRSATEVAGERGLTVNQVYIAKSRILRRLRAELEGLLD
jgi:RNA polymerase sigma-70 factor (ECF subfamily)